MINYDHFRERLFSRRMEEKISQSQLARKSGVAVAQISRYESGKSNPREDIIAKLAYGLNVNFEWLAYGKEPKTSSENVEKKSEMLTLSLSPEIIDIISTQAEWLGISPSEYASLALEIRILEEWKKAKHSHESSKQTVQINKNNPIANAMLKGVFNIDNLEKIAEALEEQLFGKPKNTVLTATQEEVEEMFKSPPRTNKKDT